MTDNPPISYSELKHLEELVRNNINLISIAFDLLKKKSQVRISSYVNLHPRQRHLIITFTKSAVGMSGKRSAVAKLLVSIEKYCEENFLFEQMKLGKSAQLILKNRDISDLDRRLGVGLPRWLRKKILRPNSYSIYSGSYSRILASWTSPTTG